MTEVKCIHGISTDRPCPRPGTVELPGILPDGVKVCEVHAALRSFGNEARDLELALEKFDELEEYAREWHNRPLLALLERAKAEFEERRGFLNEQLESVELAIR